MPQPTIVGSYAGLERFKRSCGIAGSDRDVLLLDNLNAASRAFENDARRYFFPYIATNLYRWPPIQIGWSWRLWLDQDLLSVTTLLAAAQDATPTTITHYFLEPQVEGPPYSRIEIDLSQSDAFASGSTPQRSISVLGTWGWSNNTIAAGTLAVAITTTTATTCQVSDASLIDQGEVLLIGTEAIYVSGRAPTDTTATLNGNIDSQKSTVTVTVSSGALINVGEVILLDSESMLVQAITGNNLTVIRAWDGSTLAAHTGAVKVYAPRTLTIVRAVNGTTAASHLISVAISKYQAPANVQRVIVADAVSTYQQDQAAWGRTIGAGDMAVPFTSKVLQSYRHNVLENYSRVRSAAI